MNLTQEQNDKIFELNSQGLTAGKIAQKMKLKKWVIVDVLGEAENKGLGSKVQDITAALGLDVLAETVAAAVGADDCGCAKRAESLNKLFPNRNVNDLSVEDYNYLDAFLAGKPTSVNANQQKELVDIYNRLFNSKRTVSNCSPCVAKLLKELKLIFNSVE